MTYQQFKCNPWNKLKYQKNVVLQEQQKNNNCNNMQKKWNRSKNETLTWNQSENEGQVIVKYLFQLI